MSDVLVLERPAGFASVMRDYLELSKSRIVMMVLITTAAGYFFAAQHVNWLLLLNTLLGTALVAAGTNALNQYVERDQRSQPIRRAQVLDDFAAGNLVQRDIHYLDTFARGRYSQELPQVRAAYRRARRHPFSLNCLLL